MYRRLKALSKRFKMLGADHVDDTWVRRKYVAALMHFKPIDLKILKKKHKFYEMTSNEVMQEVEASIVETKVALDKCNRALGERRGGNLALKAKAMEMEDEVEADHDSCATSSPEDIKYDLNEYLALAARTFCKNPAQFKSSLNKKDVTNRAGGFRTRVCYNCGLQDHFISECPYEKKEE